MFKSTKAKTVEEYLDQVPRERKEIVLFFHEFIKKTVPKFKSYFAYNMLGYGSFAYKNYRHKVIEWPVLALANQKNYISIYVCALDKGEYVAEKYKKELGKVRVGKSCIRITKLEDVNLAALKKVLKFAEKYPGLVEPKK